MIEIVAYRLNADADAAGYRSLDSRLQTDFYYQQPGLRRRTTACSDDGDWVSILVWDSAEHATASADAARTTGVVAQLGEFVDPASLHRSHYAEL
jgi:hypothetical protein